MNKLLVKGGVIGAIFTFGASLTYLKSPTVLKELIKKAEVVFIQSPQFESFERLVQLQIRFAQASYNQIKL